MESLIKVAVIAVAAILCAAVLKKTVPELELVLTLATGALIFFTVVEEAKRAGDEVLRLVEAAGLASGLMAPVVKAVFIAILTKITAEVCRDAKEGGIASFVEIAGTLLALTMAIPLMHQVFEGIGRLI